MKFLLAVMVALVAVVPAFAQTEEAPQTPAEEAEEARVNDALNAQLAKLEDSAGLGGEDYNAVLSGNRMFCDFFAQVQQAYPLYKGMSCQARN